MGGARRTGRPPYGLVIAALVVLLLVAVAVAAATGAVRFAVAEVVQVFAYALGLPVEAPSRAAMRIVWGIRLPRILVAALAGAALALAGTFLSGSLRNPLAEPVTAGTAAGALLGTSLVLFLGAVQTAHVVGAGATQGAVLLRILAAGLFAMATTLVVLLVTVRQNGRVLAGPLLLAGLAVNAVVGSVAALLLFVGPVGAQTAATLVIAWTFGGLLAASGIHEAVGLSVAMAVVLVFWVVLRRPLDLMLAGEEEAAAGGVDVVRVRLLALVAASLATGAAVAAAGVVAFVGLVAPFVLRRWTGPLHLRLVPAAALLGAFLLVAADAAGRALGAPGEVPAGVVTAALGAPVLLLLLGRRAAGVGA